MCAPLINTVQLMRPKGGAGMANRELGGELGSPGSAGSPLRSPSGDPRLPARSPGWEPDPLPPGSQLPGWGAGSPVRGASSPPSSPAPRPAPQLPAAGSCSPPRGAGSPNRGAGSPRGELPDPHRGDPGSPGGDPAGSQLPPGRGVGSAGELGAPQRGATLEVGEPGSPRGARSPVFGQLPAQLPGQLPSSPFRGAGGNKEVSRDDQPEPPLSARIS